MTYFTKPFLSQEDMALSNPTNLNDPIPMNINIDIRSFSRPAGLVQYKLEYPR